MLPATTVTHKIGNNGTEIRVSTNKKEMKLLSEPIMNMCSKVMMKITKSNLYFIHVSRQSEQK